MLPVQFLLSCKEGLLMDDLTPGSKAALDKGCVCPVMDNHYGKGRPIRHPENGEMQRAFWINGECIIHGDNKAASKE